MQKLVECTSCAGGLGHRRLWEAIDYEIGRTGCPILPSALAIFECKIAHTYVGGDHVIFVGEVLHADYDPAGRPLAFFRGGYVKLC
jgi:4-hydroxyphenylacetate 3-hydroxylase, reductase component